MKFRWLVLSEIGWTQFSYGFCYEAHIAAAQLSIFAARYPERAFTFKAFEK